MLSAQEINVAFFNFAFIIFSFVRINFVLFAWLCTLEPNFPILLLSAPVQDFVFLHTASLHRLAAAQHLLML